MSSPANANGRIERPPIKTDPSLSSRPTSSYQTNNPVRSHPGTPKAAIYNGSNATSRSPSVQQRRSSSTSQSRPGSSASPRLVQKTSRSSLGAASTRPEDDNQYRPTPKRSISNLITELRGAHATMEAIPEPVILTAPQIAETCFIRELAAHENFTARTLVLLHDACYGHRFSRLKTSKGTLSMIVERPERILASVLGIASTYVRMGGYHAGAHNAPHPKRAAESPPPFKIRRTNRTLELRSTYVTNIHGTDWMIELNTLCDVAEKRLAAGEKEVARVADSSGKEKRSLHEGDLYLCKESLDAFQGALGGVADAVDAVFDPSSETSRAFVAVRPPGHHCSADHPSGFCWINNVHVGIEYAAQTHGLTHAAIIDFDLHHGDGSQSITWERNSSNNYKRLYAKPNTKLKLAPDVGYYSLHDINSYPCEMGDDEKVQAASLCIHNAHGQSIWNVHLQPWKTIDEFWELYETRYLVLLEKAKEFLQSHTTRITLEGKQRPKSAVFISAGFDASEWEGEGMQRHKVSVPSDFYARFTADIAKLADTAGTACDGRVISVLEGGYSDRALCSSTMSHLSALSFYDDNNQKQHSQPVGGGLGSSMLPTSQAADLNQRMSSLTLMNGGPATYDVSWWSEENLTALEHHVNPPPPVSAGGKKVRVGPQPTYATPTESFAYKVIDPAKFARSVSGTMREGTLPSRSLTPPPPEVDWIVAAHELSKLLIPTDRPTQSCTADELAGTKIKKERNSDIGLTPSPDDLGKPRQLRTRGKTPATTRVVSGSDRRKTMADFPSLAAEVEPLATTQRKPSRRSSMASTTSTTSTLLDVSAPPVPPLPAATGVARPIPSRLPSDSMQVKKTRVNAPPTPGKPKKAAAPRSPSKKAVAMIVPATERDGSQAATNVSSPIDPEVGSVDALATGMKRITLKIGTREESDKKAKEKLDADRRARALKAAETRRINKAAREQKAAAEQSQSSIASTMSGQQLSSTISQMPEPAAALAARTGQSVPYILPSSQYDVSNAMAPPVDGQTWPSTNTMVQQQPSTAATFQPSSGYSMALPQIHAAVPFQQSKAQLTTTPGQLGQAFPAQQPLNTQSFASPWPNKGRSTHELPVFSSTGPIPFASTPTAPSQETLYSYMPAQPQAHVQDNITFGHEQTAMPGQPNDRSYDVWAVPNTPKT